MQTHKSNLRNERQYAYMKYKDRYPLELKGDMKKHFNIKGLSGPSWQQFLKKTPDFVLKKDIHRQDFAKKIIQNYQTIRTIIPSENKQNIKLQSKKIVNKQANKNISGVYYLINKSSKRSVSHSEKRHIKASNSEIKAINQKKHFDVKPSMIPEYDQLRKINKTFASRQKVSKDFMSSIQDNEYSRKQDQKIWQRTRPNSINLFRTSEEAGLKQPRNRNISNSKLNELKGNGLDKEPHKKKSLRDDFRRSTITFG